MKYKYFQIGSAVMQGNLVSCTEEEYPEVRRLLQEFAGESIDHGQSIYAVIALNEVKRLDRLFRKEEA